MVLCSLALRTILDRFDNCESWLVRPAQARGNSNSQPKQIEFGNNEHTFSIMVFHSETGSFRGYSTRKKVPGRLVVRVLELKFSSAHFDQAVRLVEVETTAFWPRLAVK